MRWNWYLPVLRKRKSGTSIRPESRLTRWARRVLPAGLFSDPGSRRRGLLRRWLKAAGPTWLASPLRRLVQAICFLTFLYLFFCVCWPYSARPVPTTAGQWPSHYADNLSQKEWLPAELFLIVDPLVSLSTAIAARTWVWSLASAAVILAICWILPRGFCGYLCPLGTLIDLFDWSIARRVTRFRIRQRGWWVHLKYGILLAILVAACAGVLLSGYFAAIPVITRAMQFTLAPLQTGAANGWHQMPPFHAGHALSLALFVVLLMLGFLQPRFWCRYVCPTGAVFSVSNLLRTSERKVVSTCIDCGKCVEVCSFDAIKPDFTTRTMDCTLCETCGGVCPTEAIQFVGRWSPVSRKLAAEEDVWERRRVLSTVLGAVCGSAVGMSGAWLTRFATGDRRPSNAAVPIRPPGSVPEREFLKMCIRCGQCYKVCPSDVLQPQGFRPQGLDGLWTPRVVADWAGCASSCNACGQVCPTGAIRALPLDEKRAVCMGLATVNTETCLPYAQREDCQLCVDECTSAGYNAVEFMRVGTQADQQGNPIEGTGYLAPVVLSEACVGCGLCQTRCYEINVAAKGLLAESAIQIAAGEGREDRLMQGSYIELRREEKRQRNERQRQMQEEAGAGDSYLPDFLNQDY